MKLKDKVCVVTGGAMGNGLGIVKVFLKYGAKVSIIDYDKSVNDVVINLKNDGSNVIGFCADIRDKASVDEAIKKTSEVFGNRIFIGDRQDMDFITYYFREEIPQWLNWILTKYNILPRPVCVGTKFQSASWKIFGFITSDPNYNSKISAFFNAQFLGDRDPQDATGSIPVTPPYDTIGIVAPKIFSFAKLENATQNFYGAMFKGDKI